MVKSWSYPQELSAVSTEKIVSLLSSSIGDDRSCPTQIDPSSPNKAANNKPLNRKLRKTSTE
jgi:hypothetical protein